MKKWIRTLCTLLLAVLVLTGCKASFDPSVSSLYIQKNGKVTSAVVESFEKDYYSFSEFETMIQREVENCNSMFSEPAIDIERLELKDSTLYLLLSFQDADAYEQYSEEYCFVGTIDEALDAGHSFDLLFKDAEYTEYSTPEVTEKKDDHVVIVQSEGFIELEGKVKYVSNNVEIISEHMAEVMEFYDEDEYAYIVY